MEFVGHGTMMAGVAASAKNEIVKFQGVASGAELVAPGSKLYCSCFK
jgi:hypothetical protein